MITRSTAKRQYYKLDGRWTKYTLTIWYENNTREYVTGKVLVRNDKDIDDFISEIKENTEKGLYTTSVIYLNGKQVSDKYMMAHCKEHYEEKQYRCTKVRLNSIDGVKVNKLFAR